MIYEMLKVIFRIALRFYFSKIIINHFEELPRDKPILFVSNHQSSFMDAILIASFIKGQLHFMSRGESFNTSLKRWIFKQFNMHPIYRKEHTPDLVSKNASLIHGFQQLLLKNHSILIFPEGISHVEPRLYPIKTGAARVVLGAWAFSAKEILVVPIGLNYENPHRFRSRAMINFGEPIELEPFKKAYEKNEKKAIYQLTEKIKTELEKLIFNVENESLNSLVPVVQSLYEKELIKKSPIKLSRHKKAFRIRKDIIEGMHFFENYFPFRAQKIKDDLHKYRKILQSNKINDKWLDRNFQPFDTQIFLTEVLYYLVGFPFFLFGLVNHLGILVMPSFVVKKIIKRPDFRGSLLLSYGVLFVIFFYILQVSIFYFLINSLAGTLIYLLSLPCAGCFAIHYFRKFQKDKDWLKFQWFLKNEKSLFKHLKACREKLLHQLRMARNDFLTSSKKSDNFKINT